MSGIGRASRAAMAAACLALALAGCGVRQVPACVGSWELTGATIAGQEVSEDTIREVSGSAPSGLVVTDDGMLECVVMGVPMRGPWSQGEDGSLSTQIDGQDASMSVDGDSLTMAWGEDDNREELRFTKAGDDLGDRLDAVGTDGQASESDLDVTTDVGVDGVSVGVTSRLDMADGTHGVRLECENSTASDVAVGVTSPDGSTGGVTATAGQTATGDVTISGWDGDSEVAIGLDVVDAATGEVLSQGTATVPAR